MAKIVNSFTSKMEVGSPMASLYLLGNPDHYTSHTFIPFYWQGYVHEVGKAWPEDGESLYREKVTLFKKGNRILGLSLVNDYVYRPKELEHMNLYEYISQCTRVPTGEKSEKEDKSKITIQNENKHLDAEVDVNFDGKPKKEVGKTYRFLKEHPFTKTQAVRLLPPKKHSVPNFVGATLPRRDQGDREYYCKTIMTLFKPWRTGKHLKGNEETWDDAFYKHVFTEQQSSILKNMHVKYECLDANDDYFAQLRAGGVQLPMGEFMNADDFDPGNGDYAWEVPDGDPAEFDNLICLSDYMNAKQARRQAQILEMRRVMTKTGWPDANPDLLPKDLDLTTAPVPTGKNWKNEVNSYRQRILDDRIKQMAASLNNGNNKIVNLDNSKVNIVKIVDKSYLEKKFYSKEHQVKVDEVAT
ncbi:hypothetical protein BDN72DRAFT_763510, partial [Pluteus cervinus]